MSITDELREYANIATDRDIYAGARLCKIADRIDAEHRAALEKLAAQVDESERIGFDQGFASADDWLAQHEDAMVEHGWVRLPLDADGVQIRLGDRLTCNGEVCEVTSLSIDREGWNLGTDNYVFDDLRFSSHPELFRHHHAPTVEDVLREFFSRYVTTKETKAEDDAILAEFAAKLRLAEEVDE